MGKSQLKYMMMTLSTLLETAKVNYCNIYSKHDSQEVR
jgi:hypothetical protein